MAAPHLLCYLTIADTAKRYGGFVLSSVGATGNDFTSRRGWGEGGDWGG